MDQYYLFIIIAPVAAIITASTAVYAWRRRTVAGALMLSLALLGNTGWIIFNSIELISKTEQANLFYAKFSYLFILSVPIFTLAFALQYTGSPKWVSYPRFLLFWILPIITFSLVQTNEMHGLIWSSVSIGPANKTLYILSISHGPWFWVQVIYNYTMIFASSLIIGTQYFRSTAFYRQQSGWLIVGAVTPLIFNVIYIFRMIPTLVKDYSPLALAFAGISFAIGVFRHRLLDIMPIARTIMIENLQEGLIVFDYEDRIIDINPAARRFLLPSSGEIVGAPLRKHLPEIAPLLSKDKQQNQAFEFPIQRNKINKQLEAKLSVLKNKKGKELGYLLILQDITERKKLYEEIKRLASTDSLTNLNNRRQLFILGKKECARASRYKHPIALLFIDIDYFKEINDSYGHTSGDETLKQFSDFLQSALRTSDIIGRYGGDEFIVILPETPLDTAHETALRLCQAVEKSSVHTTAEEIHFTISIGISGFSKGEDNVSMYILLDQADQALYKAKNQGRNQAVIWEGTKKKR